MVYRQKDFSEEPDVSRETLSDFAKWQALLEAWNNRINLVSKAGLEDYWERHALDSWQLWQHAPDSAQSFLDLGSGAGFPGLAMAIGCKQRERGQVTLVDSAHKKTVFLRTVIRELDLPAQALSDRLENITVQPYDVITARAFAPLPRLLDYAHVFWGPSTRALFLKGENVADELTEAQKYWTYKLETIPSRSDPAASVLIMTDLCAKSPS